MCVCPAHNAVATMSCERLCLRVLFCAHTMWCVPLGRECSLFFLPPPVIIVVRASSHLHCPSRRVDTGVCTCTLAVPTKVAEPIHHYYLGTSFRNGSPAMEHIQSPPVLGTPLPPAMEHTQYNMTYTLRYFNGTVSPGGRQVAISGSHSGGLYVAAFTSRLERIRS